MSKTTALFFTAVGLSVATAFGADNSDKVPYKRTENVVYKVADGVGLILDVFEPKGAKNGKALVDTLSGAWYSEQGQVNDHFRGGIFDIFCSRGYTVFMIRPGSRTRFTAEEMVKNLKTGIRWVKAHAADYGVDPEKVGITGASAGGHLTLLTVVTPEEADPGSDDPLLRFDTTVQTAAVFFPPTDFIDWNGEKPNYERLGNILFPGGLGGRSAQEVEAKAREISPALRIEKAPPPLLLIHGDADEAVPLQQSHRMVEEVEKAGGEIKLIVKEGGGHPWLTIPEEVKVMADWFDERLK